MKFLPTFAYVVGGAMSVTIAGAVAGIPVILFGRAVKKTIRTNRSVSASSTAPTEARGADAGLLEYVKSLNGKAQAAVA